MFKTSDRVSFLIILFQFLQYYVFVVLSGDAFAFSTSILLQLLQQIRKVHTKSYLHFKNRLAIIGPLLCLVAQFLLLTYLTLVMTSLVPGL